MSLFIIYDWGHTCVATILALTGIEASERTWTRALYLAYRFSVVEAVNGFKSIRSYRAGDGAWVEVDMMMNEDEKVRTAHDVAETLQYCLEGLGEVDRAFVTVDCKYPPPPYSCWPKWLLLLTNRSRYGARPCRPLIGEHLIL